MPSLRTQNRRIADALLAGDRITQLDALPRFGSVRLAARIYELKKDGLNIGKELVDVGSDRHVARYFLISDERKQLELPL